MKLQLVRCIKIYPEWNVNDGSLIGILEFNRLKSIQSGM